MIFVTVGTHEQQFNRLVEYMDNIKRDGLINEEVVIQTGYCTYQPQYSTWQNFFTYQEMLKIVDEARIIITHGGPSSFIMPLQVGKTPIVVPRQKKFDEHVNDHQVIFAQEVSERMGTILSVVDIEKLADTINNYDKIVSSVNGDILSNNTKFNKELGEIVNGMFEKKKKK